jgi:membrane protein YdbS with pleckstrin-like domain
MGYIEKNLMDGERIIYRTSLHWIIFLGPVITFLVGVILLYEQKSASVPASGILFLITIIWIIKAIISKTTSEFGVSDKRVLIKIGWIRRNSLETLLGKVEGIQVNQGILGRIFNFGTIIIRGTGGTRNSTITAGASRGKWIWPHLGHSLDLSVSRRTVGVPQPLQNWWVRSQSTI